MKDTIHHLKLLFDPLKYIKITFVGESAVDRGGPLREFFHILVKQISQMNSLFCGPEESRCIFHNVMELDKRTYYYVGMILGLSLVYGGPAPAFFCSSIAHYIARGEVSNPTFYDIPDSEVKEKLIKVSCLVPFEAYCIYVYNILGVLYYDRYITRPMWTTIIFTPIQLENAGNEIAMRELLDSEEFAFRFDIGLTQPSSSFQFSNIDYILKLFASHYLILSVMGELNEILDGLKVVKMLDLIRANPNKMEQLFIYSNPKVITAEDMFKLFPPLYSETGSNIREAEEDVVMLWVHFLQIIERKYIRGIYPPYGIEF